MFFFFTKLLPSPVIINWNSFCFYYQFMNHNSLWRNCSLALHQPLRPKLMDQLSLYSATPVLGGEGVLGDGREAGLWPHVSRRKNKQKNLGMKPILEVCAAGQIGLLGANSVCALCVFCVCVPFVLLPQAFHWAFGSLICDLFLILFFAIFL